MNLKNRIVLIFALLCTTLFCLPNWRADATSNNNKNEKIDFLNSLNIKFDKEVYPKVNLPEVKKSKEKKYVHKFKDWGVCDGGYTKSNMDLISITNKQSYQYYLKQYYWLDDYGHYRYSEKGIDYYVVALGSYYGDIGDKFRFTLSNGTILYVIKGDEKSDTQTVNGCYHPDGSVIEFIIDTYTVTNSYNNFNGGFQVYDKWNGTIVRAEKEVS